MNGIFRAIENLQLSYVVTRRAIVLITPIAVQAQTLTPLYFGCIIEFTFWYLLVGVDGFEPPKPEGSRFTVCPN